MTARCHACRYLVTALGHQDCVTRQGAVLAAALAVPGVRLLAAREVAATFRVDAATVTRWAEEGRLLSTRTPGGHRRFLAGQVRALLAGEEWAPAKQYRPGRCLPRARDRAI